MTVKMKIMIYICGALVLSTADAFLPALLRKRMTCRCGHRSQGMRRGNLSLVGNKGMSGGKVQDRQFISILSVSCRAVCYQIRDMIGIMTQMDSTCPISQGQ